MLYIFIDANIIMRFRFQEAYVWARIAELRKIYPPFDVNASYLDAEAWYYKLVSETEMRVYNEALEDFSNAHIGIFKYEYETMRQKRWMTDEEFQDAIKKNTK